MLYAEPTIADHILGAVYADFKVTVTPIPPVDNNWKEECGRCASTSTWQDNDLAPVSIDRCTGA